MSLYDEGCGVSPFGRAFSPLRHRDFALFWVSAVVSNTGSWMQTVTIPFVIFELTDSTVWLGVSAAVSFLPSFVVGPLAGAIADRYPRRRVLLITQLVQMLAAFALWGIWVAGDAALATIFACLLVSSLAAGINITSWQAFVPSLVPHEFLLSAVRLNSIQFTLARAIGPAIAGLVLGRFGAGSAFLANALTFAFVIAALLAVQARPAPARTSHGSFLREFGEGLGYVRRHRGAMQCIATVAVASLLPMSLVQLAPAIAREHLQTGDAGYGVLVSAYGVGSIAGSLLIAVHAERFRRSRTTLVSLLGAAAGALLLGGATTVGLGLAAMFVIGVGQTVVSVTQNTTVQLQVDDRYRGRVLSVYLMTLFIGVPIGTLLLGAVAEEAGIGTASVATGVLLVAYAAISQLRFGAMTALDAVRHPEAEAPELAHQPTA